MGDSSGPIRPGLALADTELSREAAGYLRPRLLIFYRVMGIAASAMYLLSHLSDLCLGEWTLADLIGPGAFVHLLSCLTAWAIFAMLSWHRCTNPQLRGLDVVGLHMMIATLLTIYAINYELGFRLLLGIMAIFIVARAVVIPSTARTTFLVSLPAAIGALVILLAHGTDYGLGGGELQDSAYVQAMIWNQVAILLGIAVATVASQVSFVLRTQVLEGRELGQYRLEEKIGQGGMGEVFRATHSMLRHPTAVKILRPDLTGEETIRRFHREVRETSRLSSPCTISIYDYGRTADGLCYYAMEYLDGADVAAIVERSGAMPPGRVIHLLDQVCRSLAEAHAQGLVHRDVKAGNIMVCRRGGEFDVVKVVDLGLVKDLVDSEGSLTQIGAVCGTPETLAPEVINGDPAAAASDLYGVGIVAYLMATGTLVFEAKAPLGLIRHHIGTVPDAPSARSPDVPEDLGAIILKLLEKDPARRFASARDLRTALAACAAAGTWSDADAARWWEEFRP